VRLYWVDIRNFSLLPNTASGPRHAQARILKAKVVKALRQQELFILLISVKRQR
jgi:hypothetical protein